MRVFDAAPVALNELVSSRETATAYGAVAEHLAIAKLLRRGHKVAIPVTDDDGVDLVVDYSIRVQVKNAHRRKFSPNGVTYDKFAWSCKSAWSRADVFLLHGLEPNGDSRWFVVPSDVIAGHGRTLLFYEAKVAAYPDSMNARIASLEGAWDVFDAA